MNTPPQDDPPGSKKHNRPPNWNIPLSEEEMKRQENPEKTKAQLRAEMEKAPGSSGSSELLSEWRLEIKKLFESDFNKILGLILMCSIIYASVESIKNTLGCNNQKPKVAKVSKVKKAEKVKQRKEAGLEYLLTSKAIADKYVFNTVTRNKQFANTAQVSRISDSLVDNEYLKIPYDASVFKPFDDRSNLRLPARIGISKKGNLADLINNVTIYNAENSDKIKHMIITSYKLSYGIVLNTNDIEITAKDNGTIDTVRYVGNNPESLMVTTEIATRLKAKAHNKEEYSVLSSKNKNWPLVDGMGNLLMQPSLNSEVGIYVPNEDIVEVKEVSYAKVFKSQGKKIEVHIRVPIELLKAEHEALKNSNESPSYQLDDRTFVHNLAWYVPPDTDLQDEDPVWILAQQITSHFDTAREKAQAILDFENQLDYIPSNSRSIPTSSKTTLVSRGSNCTGASVLAVDLAKAAGIECKLLYFLKNQHAAVACDVGGKFSKRAKKKHVAATDGKKNFEWMEVTGRSAKRVKSRRSGKWIIIRKNRHWEVGEKSKPMEGGVDFVQKIGGSLMMGTGKK